MIFRKKKRMIDVRELQRRGVVRIPKQDIVVPTDRDGFVEFGGRLKPTTNNQEPITNNQSNTEFFGFMNSSSSAASVPSAGSPESSLGESTGRNESERITELDNKIYKLEQRIELLEKKLDINQSSEPSVGVMGW